MDIQFVEIELDPGKVAVAEAGAMMYMDSGIQMEPKLGDGSEKNSGILGSVLGMGKRLIVREGAFLTFFTNRAAIKRRVAFAAPYPGMIVPLDLATLGGNVMCQKESFLCCAKGVSVNIGVNKRVAVGLFGGEGFLMQSLQGDGIAFIHAGGSIVERELRSGEAMYVDTGSVTAFQSSVSFDIRLIRGIKSMFFADEGFFLSTLTGPGKVWIQSMPYQRFIKNLSVAVLEEARRTTRKGMNKKR